MAEKGLVQWFKTSDNAEFGILRTGKGKLFFHLNHEMSVMDSGGDEPIFYFTTSLETGKGSIRPRRGERIVFERGVDREDRPIASQWARASEWESVQSEIDARKRTAKA